VKKQRLVSVIVTTPIVSATWEAQPRLLESSNSGFRTMLGSIMKLLKTKGDRQRERERERERERGREKKQVQRLKQFH
jgi:hypothetical protein